MPGAGLSPRGARLLAFPRPSFAQAHYDSIGKSYDPASRPAGVVNLSLAENRISAELVAERLTKAGPCASMDSMLYNPYPGCDALRRSLARVVSRHMAMREVDPSRLVVTNGAGSALLLLATMLADAGDAALLPTPYYYAYDRDFGALAGVAVVRVKDGGAEGQLQPAALTAAAERAEAGGTPCRLLVLTSPDNPSGGILSPAELQGAVDWAAARGVHVIVNELYGCTVRDPTFRSVLRVYSGGLPPHVHFVWGLSKDFAASGLRCGCLYSDNKAVVDSATKYSYFYQMGGTVQRQLADALGDDAWVDGYLAESRRRIAAAVSDVEHALDAAGIQYAPSKGALFVYISLAPWVEAAGGEVQLFDHLRSQPGGGVLLCPGNSFGGAPGSFRICVTAAPPDHLREGMRRLVAGLRTLPRKAAL
eukprot:TRINITY_DN51971_c0_g1_i1.p1 TRINITY_DN51971_c0_g1~~TRINITY_DN51971_c0_g1_i1.p1  ORF type:complete len:449 (+),score=136.80 TRINITY_DN51971_c0_g1_i1:85-1347(+)